MISLGGDFLRLSLDKLNNTCYNTGVILKKGELYAAKG